MDRLGSGVTLISNAWNGDAMNQRLAGGKIKYCFAKEGAVGWYDSLVIPKGAENRPLLTCSMNGAMGSKAAALVEPE